MTITRFGIAPSIPGHRIDPANRPTVIALARARASRELPPEYLWYDGNAISPRGVLPARRHRDYGGLHLAPNGSINGD